MKEKGIGDPKYTIENFKRDYGNIYDHIHSVGFHKGFKAGRSGQTPTPAPSSPATVPSSSATDQGLTESDWDRDPAIRAEFGGDRERFEAYIKNQKHIRVVTGNATRESHAASEEQPATDAIETQARAEWDADESLRGEFLGNFAVYCAYRQAVAKGRVKRIGGL